MENKQKNEKAFYAHDGKIILDLKSLAKELREMPHNVYNHHVNFNKNDFANWIKHSLNEHTLAEKINSDISKVELELEVLRHLFDGKENLVKKLQAGKVAKKVSTPKTVAVKKENSKKVTIKKD